MFWLTIISSIASIASLALSFFDFFKKWRVAILCIGSLLGGMTIGIIMSMNEKVVKSFTQAQLLHLILLVVIVGFAALILLLFKKIIEDTEGGMALAVLVILVVFAACAFIGYSFNSDSSNNSNDYMILYSHYYNLGDYAKCADFLKEYESSVRNELTIAQTDSIDHVIQALYYKSSGLK